MYQYFGGKIHVIMSAIVDIYAGDDFSDNLPLEIETEVNFYGIPCGKNTSMETNLLVLGDY